jgi:hypothetical protein
MGLHDPFEYLKHKLWLKEGLGIKVPIWPPTTKSQESPWFYLHVGGVPYIFAKLSTRATTLLHTSPQLKLCTQSYEPPKCQKSQFQELSRQNDIWMQPSWLIIKNTMGGRRWLPPSPSCGESYESVYAHGSFVHQKWSNYALTNLLFGLCKSMWIVNPLVAHHSSHPEAPTCPFYS